MIAPLTAPIEVGRDAIHLQPGFVHACVRTALVSAKSAAARQHEGDL